MKWKRTPRYYNGNQNVGHSLEKVSKFLIKRVSFTCKVGVNLEYVKSVWKTILPINLISMTCVLSFSNGILKVGVNNASLHFLLVNKEKKRIIEDFNKLSELHVKDVFFLRR